MCVFVSVLMSECALNIPINVPTVFWCSEDV